MMKQLLVSVALLLVAASSSAEPGDVLWANSFDGGSFSGLDITLSGGNICAGKDGTQIYVLETDADGNELWSASYGGAEDDEAEDVKALPDGGFVICGQTESYTADIEDAFLWKLDASGDLVWEQYYDGPGYTNFQSLILNADGNIVCAGYSQSADAGYEGIVAIYSPEGDLLDSAIIGTVVDDVFAEVQQTSDGGYILCGYTHPSGNDEYWLVKLNGDLDAEWRRSYDETTRARATCVTPVADGGYFLGGFVGNYGDAVAWLLRLDEIGDVIWQQTYGGDYWNSCNDLLALDDGGFAVAGFNSPVDGTWHPWVFTIDAVGAVRWETIYDVESGGTAIKLAEDSLGDLLVCGQIRLGWFSYALLMKIENASDSSAVDTPPTAWTELRAHPNPFNPRTTISFALDRPQRAEVAVYDLTGRQIAVLAGRAFDAGNHAVVWNGKDAQGRAVPSGTYVVHLSTGSTTQARKVLLVR